MIRTFIELLDESDPVLALAIHNGHEMHPDLMSVCGISEADRLREEDPFTEHFAQAFKNKIIVYRSRFTVDLNRRREQSVYLKPEDCWGLPVRTETLSAELISELLSSYDDWYKILTYTVQRLLSKHPFLLILDLHSYNYRRQGAEGPADPQEANPDIILGRNNMPQAYYDRIDALRSRLDGKVVKGHKLDCRIDVKFTGGQLSRWLHQTFPGQVICPAVEFKKIFMDEWTGALDNAFQQDLSSVFYQAVQDSRAELLKA